MISKKEMLRRLMAEMLCLEVPVGLNTPTVIWMRDEFKKLIQRYILEES